MSHTYEVEQKFHAPELCDLERRLLEMGARPGEPIEQVDCYFAHPARDFELTDEALRIRRVGTRCSVTYKGPKIDATTKTRREIDLPLPTGETVADQYAGLLETLGFRRVAEVRKRRRPLKLPWRDVLVDIALDEVDEVGSFVELELISESSELEVAKQHIADLAGTLGLARNERRSYLELLLESRR
jgi:adenylate cyclase class 2